MTSKTPGAKPLRIKALRTQLLRTRSVARVAGSAVPSRTVTVRHFQVSGSAVSRAFRSQD